MGLLSLDSLNCQCPDKCNPLLVRQFTKSKTCKNYTRSGLSKTTFKTQTAELSKMTTFDPDMWHSDKFGYGDCFEQKKAQYIKRATFQTITKSADKVSKISEPVTLEYRVFTSCHYIVDDTEFPVLFVLGRDVSTLLCGTFYFCGYIVGCKQHAEKFLPDSNKKIQKSSMPNFSSFDFLTVEDGQITFARNHEGKFIDLCSMWTGRSFSRRSGKGNDCSWVCSAVRSSQASKEKNKRARIQQVCNSKLKLYFDSESNKFACNVKDITLSHSCDDLNNFRLLNDVKRLIREDLSKNQYHVRSTGEFL